MYIITVNIYKYNNFKWQEQVSLDASNIIEAKQKALLLKSSSNWSMDLTVHPDLCTIKRI